MDEIPKPKPPRKVTVIFNAGEAAAVTIAMDDHERERLSRDFLGGQHSGSYDYHGDDRHGQFTLLFADVMCIY